MGFVKILVIRLKIYYFNGLIKKCFGRERELRKLVGLDWNWSWLGGVGEGDGSK